MRPLVLLLFLLISATSFGQTCCSGGVPIAAGLGLPNEDAKTLQLQLNYDLNVLQTLKTGTEVIDDDSRTRRTHSFLIQTAYNFSQRFGIETLFAWVQQDRRIQQFGREELTRTSGIGDAVVLLKYQVWMSNSGQNTFTIAAGPKIPLGPADLRRDDGLTINADLQPGSGAWDGVFWGQFIHSPSSRPSMSFNLTSVYSLKGSNNNYLGQQRYRFGNEFQIIAGVADRVFIGQAIIDPSLSLRYRNVPSDQLNDQAVPSTGGEWLFINPGFSYWLSPKYAFQGRIELPLFANLTGTQVSPSYRLNIGFSAKIGLKKQNDHFNF